MICLSKTKTCILRSQDYRAKLEPTLAKVRLQSIIIDFYTDFLLVKNRLYVTHLDTKMDNIGILYSSEKVNFIVWKMDFFEV